MKDAFEVLSLCSLPFFIPKRKNYQNFLKYYFPLKYYILTWGPLTEFRNSMNFNRKIYISYLTKM